MIINNKKEFDEIINSNDYVVVDFFAEWCGPCKMLGPIFEEVANEIKDAKMFKVNIDSCEELAAQYSVDSIPTIIFFKKGEAIGKARGFLDKEALIEKINSYK